MKRLAISDLERAKNEESLQTTHKIPCSCCLKEFLYVNLPLKVSRKAIIDIRIKWSGKLSSSTVFGEIPHLDDFGEGGTANSGTIGGRRTGTTVGGRTRGFSRTTNSASTTNTDVIGGQPSNLNMVPRCYDEVSVCVFCAQFFHIQEEYRPSFSAITYQERKALHFDNKRKEKEYWDPLEMIKKDRDAYEQSLVSSRVVIIVLCLSCYMVFCLFFGLLTLVELICHSFCRGLLIANIFLYRRRMKLL